MNIRRLTPVDATAYRALMLVAYVEHPFAFTSSAEERASLPLSWWEARLAEGPGTPVVVLGAFDGDRLAGTVGLEFETRSKARHKATLFGMFVPGDAQGQGVGRALVTAALAQARTRVGVLLVQLTVTDGNQEAQTLYGRCGFVSFGVEPMAVAVGPDFVAKVHMWYDLRLPVPARGEPAP